MKAKTTKSKAQAKVAKPAAKKTAAKAPAKAAKAVKAPGRKPVAKVAKVVKPVKPAAAKAPAPADAPSVAKAAARPPKGALAAKAAVRVEPAKPAGRPGRTPVKPAIPRPQLIAQRRKEAAHFRELLLNKQREQTQAYAASKQDSESHLDNGTEDYIDYAVNSYAREFLLSLTEMDRKQLLQIEEALRRIDRGEFGRCQQCGLEIPRKRLEIQPWARHCVSCQELEEKGLLPQGTFHAGEEEYDAEEEPAAAADDDLEAEPEVEEPEEEEPVLDDEPLVVDAEDAEE